MLTVVVPGARAVVRKTYVSKCPRDEEELLRSLRLLLKEGRIDEARELLEYGHQRGMYR